MFLPYAICIGEAFPPVLCSLQVPWEALTRFITTILSVNASFASISHYQIPLVHVKGVVWHYEGSNPDQIQSSMSDERLSRLALMHVHRNMELDLERGLGGWDASVHRRIVTCSEER